jgi:nitroreductase
MNRQPWEFVLIGDRDTLREISEAEGAGSHLAKASCAIVVVMAGISRELESYDEGRLTERLLLAGAAHGLAAGIWWFKDGGAAAKRILGIPDERRVRTAVGYGYHDEAAESSRPKRPDARKPLSDLVHEGRYRQPEP